MIINNINGKKSWYNIVPFHLSSKALNHCEIFHNRIWFQLLQYQHLIQSITKILTVPCKKKINIFLSYENII